MSSRRRAVLWVVTDDQRELRDTFREAQNGSHNPLELPVAHPWKHRQRANALGETLSDRQTPGRVPKMGIGAGEVDRRRGSARRWRRPIRRGARAARRVECSAVRTGGDVIALRPRHVRQLDPGGGRHAARGRERVVRRRGRACDARRSRRPGAAACAAARRPGWRPGARYPNQTVVVAGALAVERSSATRSASTGSALSTAPPSPHAPRFLAG